MTRAELLAFLRSHSYAVQASVAPGTGVQAAVVGIAVADDFAIVFDTIDNTRKAQNLALDPRIALVIGGVRDGEEQTVQCEGVAERLKGADMRVVEELYFRKFPDGRDRLGWKASCTCACARGGCVTATSAPTRRSLSNWTRQGLPRSRDARGGGDG